LGDTLALTWIKEDENITDLFYYEVGADREIKVADGNISHPTLLSGGVDGSKPVIGWKDYDLEKLFVTEKVNGDWITSELYSSSRYIDKFCWDYTNLKPFATFVEKDDITSKPNCTLVHRTFNAVPDIPSKPDGNSRGKIGEDYMFSTSTLDVEEDLLYYLWDWGDGNNSEWLGPYGSGVTAGVTYNWSAKGSYSIKVKAKDIYGKESSWSDPLPITMPYSYNPFQQFLDWLFQRFPHVFPILRLLLGY
jgi:hypothetical protein